MFRAVVSSDDSFQGVLLELSEAARKGLNFEEMVRLFCRTVRQHFNVSSAFCWLLSGNELQGIEGDGEYAQRFFGRRIPVHTDTYSGRAVRDRVMVVVNDVPAHPDQLVDETPLESILVAPLIVASRVVGAVVFCHGEKKHFFTEELSAKAQILATLLGNLIETSRLTRASQEERRRSEALMKCAQALHANLRVNAVSNEFARSVCDLLLARATILLVRVGEELKIASIYSPDEGTRASLVEHHRERICPVAARMALKAIETGEVVDVRLEETGDAPPAHLTEGQLLAAPLFTNNTNAALLVYPRPNLEFDDQQIALLRAITGFGAMAVSNAELLEKSDGQTRELQQLLAITGELSGAGDLDRFLEKFVVRAAEFLGFERSGIALNDSDGKCRLRWAMLEPGQAQPLVVEVPWRVQKYVIEEKQVFWTDDVHSLPDIDFEFVDRFQIKQGLAAPLIGSQGQSLGALAVLDRKDGGKIQPEDVRRAEALAGAVATVLERNQSLYVSLQHQRRAEELVKLALDVGSSIRLPDLVRALTNRAAAMVGAAAAAVLLARGSTLETVYLFSGPEVEDKSLTRRLNLAMTEFLTRRGDDVSFGSASELLGQGLSEALEWRNVAIARMASGDHDLIGVLCLANLPDELSIDDRSLLKAITAHASVALDNSRLFTRIAQANSQWVEIFDAITDLIVVHDQTHRVMRVNRSMADFIGVRPAELVGVSMRALMELAHENGSEPCPFCRSNADETDEYLQSVLERTYLVSTSTIRGALDEGRQTIHVLKDITDRREAERRYRELFDNIQEGLFFSTPDGRFVEVNNALVRMLGYESREDLLKVDISRELYDDPNQRRRFQDAVNSAGVLRNFEEVLRRKDGTRVVTLQNAFAVRDNQGRVVQYRGLILDITDLKNFQAELQRQRDFNASILNNTQSLIVVSDTAGLITFANQRCYELGGYNPGDLVGHPLVELVSADKRSQLRDALERTIEGEQVASIELPVLMGDRGVGQYSISLSPMRNDQGHVNSIVVVMTDVTDAAILQAKLMHTEKMAAVGQLVSGVAHEVNNPLTSILGFADLLCEQPDMPEPAKHDLGVIIQEAQRTKQIVQNLLSFARQMPPQRQSVQVNDILRRTLQLRAYDFSNHGIKLVLDLSEPMPNVVGDPHQLQQVFLNILNNAYDAVRETEKPDGSVCVTSTMADGFVEVRFTDTGKGISAPERIFDPFYTTKEVGKGTGLGLSICYGIVREHGGEVFSENRKDATGAVFTVRLPLASEDVEAAQSGKGA